MVAKDKLDVKAYLVHIALRYESPDSCGRKRLYYDTGVYNGVLYFWRVKGLIIQPLQLTFHWRCLKNMRIH